MLLMSVYRGVLGLNCQPFNATTLGNYSAPALLTALKEQKYIPSLSWSYTAGARYRMSSAISRLHILFIFPLSDPSQASNKSTASSSSPATTSPASPPTRRPSAWPAT